MGSDPMVWDLPQLGSGVCRDRLLGVLLMGLMGGALLWSEASHQMCHLVLGPLVLVKVSCCL